MGTSTNISKPVWWAATILKGLLALFLAFDAIMKVIKNAQYVEGTKQMGLPESCVSFLGIYLLLSTILYIYPRTVVMGMLFLCAYLGGAVAIGYRANAEGHPYIFPIIFTILIVVAEFLRDEKLRTVIPLVK